MPPHLDTYFHLGWIEATILWKGPPREAFPSNTQTDDRVSRLHLMFRLRPDARGVEFRGALLRPLILLGSRHTV